MTQSNTNSTNHSFRLPVCITFEWSIKISGWCWVGVGMGIHFHIYILLIFIGGSAQIGSSLFTAFTNGSRSFSKRLKGMLCTGPIHVQLVILHTRGEQEFTYPACTFHWKYFNLLCGPISCKDSGSPKMEEILSHYDMINSGNLTPLGTL